MRINRRARAPRRVLLLFLAVTLLPGAALGWVSWQLIEQDRELEDKRVQDDLEHAADLVSAELDRRLREAAEQLSEGIEASAELPDGALTVVVEPHRIEAKPANRLLYYPAPPLPAAPSAVAFEAGEAHEYRKDYDGAIAAFRELSQSQDPSIRAGALARLARNLRLSGQTQAALDVYTQLERLGSVLVGTVPAGLFAREARCDTLRQAQRYSELQREVALLAEDLKTGRWPVGRLDFNRLHEEEIPRWSGGAAVEALNEDTLALAESVEWVWQEWRKMRGDQAVSAGRQSLWLRGRPVLVLWRGSASSLTAFIAGRDYIQSQWSSAWTDHDVDVALSDSEGHPVLGATPAKTLPVALRSVAESRLPWTLRATPANPSSVSTAFTARRRLLLTGLVIMVVLTATGGYFTVRAASREFAVARLQSDSSQRCLMSFERRSHRYGTSPSCSKRGPLPMRIARDANSATGCWREKLNACIAWLKGCWISAEWRLAETTMPSRRSIRPTSFERSFPSFNLPRRP